ncbi:MAG: hypothetical protein QJR13_00090 [Bacillota bacterium]|nr:hypothetical protein [Bacillota bacterium]
MGEKHGVVRHLRFARQWLEQAEQEFSKDNPVRGELTLSLVLGEVRRAWEMSRQGRSVRRQAWALPGRADARPRGRLFRAAAWGGGLLAVALAVLGWLAQPAAAPVLPTPVAAVTPAPAAPAPREQPPAPAPRPKAVAAVRPVGAEAVPTAPLAASTAAGGGELSAAEEVKGADGVTGGGPTPALAEPVAPAAAAPAAADPAAAAAEADRPAPQIELDLNQLVKLASDSLRGSAGHP